MSATTFVFLVGIFCFLVCVACVYALGNHKDCLLFAASVIAGVLTIVTFATATFVMAPKDYGWRTVVGADGSTLSYPSRRAAPGDLKN